MMNYKLFLSGIFIAVICLSLHAEEAASGIYYGNASISGKEYIFDQNDSPKKTHPVNNYKKAAGIKKETHDSAPAENGSAEREPPVVVLPAIPLAPSSSGFFRDGQESVAVSLQQRHDKPISAIKSGRENTFPDITNYRLSFYHPRQRQKLSSAATQCGMLTSFASNFPPAFRALSHTFRALSHTFRALSHTAINA